MRTLNCFVIIPSGKNLPMRLVLDDKHGLIVAPSSCKIDHTPAAISVNFEEIFEGIILSAINDVNQANPEVKIECTRGEDLTQSGNIVSQFLQKICLAEITITDVTGLNPNVLLEYGIRLSVRDSLNILLCHEGMTLPIDIADHRFISYRTDITSANKAKIKITDTIKKALPLLLKGQDSPNAENLFRRTVELATGRDLERKLTIAIESAPSLLVTLFNDLKRLENELKRLNKDGGMRADPKLRDKTWDFLETLGKTLQEFPSGLDRSIHVYNLLTRLEGFNEKRRDIFYKLNEICAADPNREKEAENYLKEAKNLE